MILENFRDSTGRKFAVYSEFY